MSAPFASSKAPPPFTGGDDYDVWKKDLELLHMFADLGVKKQAIAVHLSLTGRARSATTELTIEYMKRPDTMETLLAKLESFCPRSELEMLSCIHEI